jgi:hypothetical protein
VKLGELVGWTLLLVLLTVLAVLLFPPASIHLR